MTDDRSLTGRLARLVEPIDVDEGWERTRRRIDRSRRRRTVIAIAGPLMALGLGSGVVALATSDDDERQTVSAGQPEITTDGTLPDGTPAWDPDLAPGWHRIADPPIEARTAAAVVWTGEVVFVWGGTAGAPGEGGADTPMSDGAVYDSATNEWAELPPAPLGPAREPVAVWTGEAVVVVAVPEGEDRMVAAQWQPDTNDWTGASPGPSGYPQTGDREDPSASHFSVVWTGDEVIVGDPPAAYDPEADTWRDLPRPPTDLVEGRLNWNGEEVLLFGRAEGYDRPAGDGLGFAYDPGSDAWRELPPSGLNAQSVASVWDGERLVAVNYDMTAAQYEAGGWEALPDLPLRFAECSPRVVAGTDFTLAGLCIGLGLLRDGEWTTVATDDARGLGEMVSLGGAVAVLGTASYLFVPPPGDEPPARIAVGVVNMDVPDGAEIARSHREADQGLVEEIVVQLDLRPGVRCLVSSTYGTPGQLDVYATADGAATRTIDLADGQAEVVSVPEDARDSYHHLAWLPLETDLVDVACPTEDDALEVARHITDPSP